MNTRKNKGKGSAAFNQGAASDYRHPLVESIKSYFESLAKVKDPGKRQVRWNPRAVATATVLMALGNRPTLRFACQEALASLTHDRCFKRVGKTYNGLVKAQLRQADGVLPLVKADLRCRAKIALQHVEKTCGWTLLAIDGSKVDLPRTLSNEHHFGIADNGKCPQAFITAIVEVHTKLLWDWRVDRGNASEKKHLVEMVKELPSDSLLLADGNFVGYGIWQALEKQSRAFLIRVGGNVSLLRNLWPEANIKLKGNSVYVWPKDLQKKVPPLCLRLIVLGKASRRIYLLTNVTEPSRLSSKAAGKMYRLRWGAEIFYRGFKRTLGFFKLKSRTGRRGRVELEWAMVACCVMTLMGIAAVSRLKRDARRISHAGLLEVVRRRLNENPRRVRGLQQFQLALACCLKDTYQRRGSKASRYRPRTKNTPRSHVLKPPKLRRATGKERLLACNQQWKMAA